MADSNSPRVSIVMPTYARAHVIQESIQSLLDQSFHDFELLVRDDCSPEATKEVVSAFDDPRIRYHRNAARLRMPGNLNSGISECRGEFILVCHDHDLYHRNLVEKMVDALEERPTALFVHCGVRFIAGEERQITREYVEDFPPLVSGSQWLKFMLSKFDCPVCAIAMVRRSTYEKSGLYADEFGFISDIEMWMRLSQEGDVAYVPEALITLRERENDHEYARTNWQLIDNLLRIHRRYGSGNQARSLLRADWYLLRHYAAAIYHKDHEAHLAGQRYLRSSGVLVSRIAAYLV